MPTPTRDDNWFRTTALATGSGASGRVLDCGVCTPKPPPPPSPFRFTAGPGELAISGWPLGTVIDWGDGTTTTTTTAEALHTYAVGGSGSIPGVPVGGGINGTSVSGAALLGVDDWGSGPFNSTYTGWGAYVSFTFYSYVDDVAWSGRPSPNLTYVPATVPPGATILASMFYGTAFNQDISAWDVSNVTNTRGMFYDAAFNQDISAWDVSNVTDMGSMFYGAAFNQDISGWDVSSVTDMRHMFQVAAAFNQDLSPWCVSQFPTKPANFDTGATAWVLPKPVWGTCP